MSRRTRTARKKPWTRDGATTLPRRRRFIAGIAAVALCLMVGGATLGLWSVPSVIHTTPKPADALPSPPLVLSKEYIYAGQRLVATEEPSAVAGPAPSALSATATSFAPAASVALHWGAADGATHYEVERGAWNAQTGRVEYAALAASIAGLNYSDSGLHADTAYLYRVRAVFPGGGKSDYATPDLATTVAFTDDLRANVPIKATHLLELRRAVNAVRTLGGLGPASWTYPDPISQPVSARRGIYLEDIQELRLRLGEALTALGFSAVYPETPPLARGAAIRAEHFAQIRDHVR